MYKDGGTIEIHTEYGIYCIDNRLQSRTKGRLYNGYPKDDNTNIIDETGFMKKEILEYLQQTDNQFHKKHEEQIVNLFNTNQGVNGTSGFPIIN